VFTGSTVRHRAEECTLIKVSSSTLVVAMRAFWLFSTILGFGCAGHFTPPAHCLEVQHRIVAPATTLSDSELISVVGAPRLGPVDAAITIVVFSDFQCPYCGRARQALHDLRAMYPDDVRVVWRDLPLSRHADAQLAAEAAREVYAQRGDDGFWRFHDLLFGHQDHLSRRDLEGYAERVGVDLERFRRALDEAIHEDGVHTDTVMAQRLGVDGTPAFFVNGTPLMGVPTVDVLEQLAREILLRRQAAPNASTFYADMVANPLPTPERPNGRPAWATVHEMPVPSGAASMGPMDAPLVMQVFSDFQCPYCSRVEPTLQALREHFGQRLRMVWRDYPLPGHPFAMPAAEAAREVLAQRGEAAFWRFHDTLFAHQSEDGGLALASLERYATELNVDLARFRTALTDHRHLPAIRADMEAITATGIRFGTPSFFINGHFMSGARPLAEFRARMEALLQAQPAPQNVAPSTASTQ
jgi:protein-disulfide isomerase